MRKHTHEKYLVRSIITWFSTIFLMLQNIIGTLASLKQMFVSQEWPESTDSKKVEGEDVTSIVFNNKFLQ